MAPPFSREEYANRLTRVRAAMERRGFDALVIGDPANINWLTGYDAWSFYTPQIMVVGLECEPTWLGREMDAGAAAFTTYLPDDQVVPFPETLVQQQDVHPAQFMGDWMVSKGFDGQRIGYESDVYFLTPAAAGHLKSRLANSTWSDCGLLVNWRRLTKSPAELTMLRQAAEIAGRAMQAAYDGVRPGVRQCDLMADVTAAMIRGTPEFGGDLPALYPLVLAGEAASTAHPMWTDAPFEADQTIAFELGGCRKRYNAGLARTAHLGEPPETLVTTAKAVAEGMDAVLDAMRAGALCCDVHAAWQTVLEGYGFGEKEPDRLFHRRRLRPGLGRAHDQLPPRRRNPLPENAVVHIILGMWMEGWGMELSETIHVRENDAVCLTQFPRDVHVIAEWKSGAGMGKKLTDAQIAAFHRDGFVSPIDVFSESEALRLRKELEAAEEKWPDAFVGSARNNAHLNLKCLDEIVHNETLVDAVEDLIGSDILNYGTVLFIKEAGDPGFVSWHQDARYMGLEPHVGITAWVALSHSNEESGCMQMIPGSHGEIRDHKDTFGDKNILTRGQEIGGIDESKAVSLRLRPGQMSIHSARVIHSSQPNNSGDRRIGFVIQPYMPPHVKQTIKRTAAQLIRGGDPYGNFDIVGRPKTNMAPEDVAIRDRINADWADILYDGAERRRDF